MARVAVRSTNAAGAVAIVSDKRVAMVIRRENKLGVIIALDLGDRPPSPQRLRQRAVVKVIEFTAYG